MKVLDNNLFGEIKTVAERNPRRRMNYDLRTQAEESGWVDMSQRMLNVMMADTVIPIHRHRETSETVIVLRGSGDEVIFDAAGKEVERVTLTYGKECGAVQVPRNAYHTFVPKEDGTVIFEAKDRAYDPDTTEDMLSEK